MRNFLDLIRQIVAGSSKRDGGFGREPSPPSSMDDVRHAPEASLGGSKQDKAQEVGDMIHDALENVVAKLVAEITDEQREQPPETGAIQGSERLQELKRPNLGSAWVVIEDPETGKVLLGKRAKTANNAGQWNLFGGGIEGTETALQTALRELWEEGGIQARPEQVQRVPGTPGNITIFALSMTDADVRAALRLNPKEVSKVRWCDPDALPAKLHKSALGLVHAGRAQAVAPAWHASAGAGNAMRHAMDVVEGKKPRT